MSLSRLSKLALLSAVAVASRVALLAFPQVKPLLAIVVLTGVCFGSVSGALVGAVSIFSSNLILGTGVWTVFQVIGASLVGAISGAPFFRRFRRTENAHFQHDKHPPMLRANGARAFITAVFGGFAALFIYGPIVNIGSVIMFKEPFNLANILAFSLSGLPFDVVHALSTFAFVLVLCPMFSLLSE